MENDDLQTDALNTKSVLKYKTRLECLFDITVELRGDEDAVPSQVCRFICQNDLAQKNLDKAKKYLQAALEEGPGFSVTTESYDPELVNMILLHRDRIEKETATVITASLPSCDVQIQGQLQDIVITKELIQNLMTKGDMTHETSQTMESESHSVPYVHAYFQRSRAVRNSDDEDDFGDDSDSDSDDLSAHEDVIYCDEAKELKHPKFPHLDFPPSVGQISLTDQSSDSADTSEDEELLQAIQNGPDYQSRVEFTLKLGYQEQDLLRALRKVGINAKENELLSELIKQDASKGDSEVDAESPTILSPDFDDGSDIVYSRKHVIQGDPGSNLRHIIIDGSNVAMSHGNKEVFSCRGIQLTVDWFRQRGHTEITVFVPQWRKETPRSGARIKDQSILTNLEKEKILVFTPARRIGGKRVVCYDDRYVLKLAVETDGVVVSNDNYRDLISEKEEFKKIIEERLLMYSFVNDRFMPPDDPLGRGGPTLDNFLLREPSQPEPLPPTCPYGSKKCTYGNKCKYYHPERKNQPHKSVTEKLAEQTKQRMQEMKERNSQGEGKRKLTQKTSLHRTKSFTPGETSQSDLSHLHPSLSGSVSTLELTDDDKYLLYNQKMADNRRKMEFENALRQQLASGQRRGSEKLDSQPKVKAPEKTEGVSSQPKVKAAEKSESLSSPRRQGGAIDSLRSQGSSRGSSPVSNLNVPGHVSNLDNGEQFLSGHLLLAKKLSDEANSESDMMKNLSRGAEGDRQHPSFGFGNVRGKSEEPARQKPKQPAKQLLSRQLSLQGSEDPRLRQIHKGLQAQYSYDPRRVTLGNQFSAPATEQGRQGFGAIGLDMHAPQARGPSQDSHFSHAPLSRMQSAPDPFVLQQSQQRKIPLVKRQNSSSDTQLDKLDCDSYTQFGEGVFSSGHYGNFMSQSNRPMKDKTGSVTFQIGGVPQHRQPVSHYRSAGAVNQPHLQYNKSEMDIHYQNQYQHQHPQQLHQQPPVSMYGDMAPSSASYMSPASPSMMPSYPGNQPGYLSSHSGMMDQGQSFYDQSGIWENNLPNQTNISLPSHYTQAHLQHGLPLASQGLRTGSPHRMSPDPSQALPYMPHQQHQQQQHQHQHLQQHQHQQQMWQTSPPITPHPSIQAHPRTPDAPIQENDPRCKVYYHLCGLFPEEKVRAVMNQHPECTDPKKICAYIISL